MLSAELEQELLLLPAGNGECVEVGVGQTRSVELKLNTPLSFGRVSLADLGLGEGPLPEPQARTARSASPH